MYREKMPRTGPSSADQELIGYASERNAAATARKLERWRGQGLLEPNQRSFPGRGKGSTSVPPSGAHELVVWLARNARPGRRPGDLALLAFAAGHAVPEATVRAAFAAAIKTIRLPARLDAAPGTDPDDVADAVVAARPRLTMIPARIRRIDAALQDMGIDWSAPRLAGLDPGLADEPPARDDLVYTAVRAMLTGGAGLDMASIGSFARLMAPAGGAAPLAGQIEYRWPVSRGKEPPGLPSDEDVVSLLANQDLREQMTALAAATPLDELRDAFTLARSLPGWAADTCAVTEAEIAAGDLGQAARQWAIYSAGLTRLILIFSLDSTAPGPADTAVAALGWVFVRNMIRSLRALLPASNFEVLSNPLSVPEFIVAFLTS